MDCPGCGETVSGIRGFRNGLAIDTVLLDSDDSIAQAVIAKVRRVKAGEPEPGTEDKDKGDTPDLPENFQF